MSPLIIHLKLPPGADAPLARALSTGCAVAASKFVGSHKIIIINFVAQCGALVL